MQSKYLKFFHLVIHSTFTEHNIPGATVGAKDAKMKAGAQPLSTTQDDQSLQNTLESVIIEGWKGAWCGPKQSVCVWVGGEWGVVAKKPSQRRCSMLKR